jgi:hypothetical protein
MPAGGAAQKIQALGEPSTFQHSTFVPFSARCKEVGPKGNRFKFKGIRMAAHGAELHRRP